MHEIKSTTVQIKTNDTDKDKHYLVHDGKQVIGFGKPGTTATVASRYTMVVGTKAELQAEIKKLKLKPELDYRKLSRDEIAKLKQKIKEEKLDGKDTKENDSDKSKNNL